MAKRKNSKYTPRGTCFLCGRSGIQARGAHAHLRDELNFTGWTEPFLWISLRSGPYDTVAQAEYWMEIGVHAHVPLKILDDFLRDVWLECCGHLSEFRVGHERFVSHPEDPDETGMEEVLVVNALRPGETFQYEYDFGTPTVITGKVRGYFDGPIADRHLWKGAVLLAMRNRMPQVSCTRCDRPATHAFEGEPRCLSHVPPDEIALPLVNSPRAGMCGYTGLPPGFCYEEPDEPEVSR